MKKIISLAVLALTVAVFSSSAMSGSLKKNKAYDFPVEVSDDAPVLIFPITLHGVPGNTQEVGLAITAGAAVQHGKSVISAQQLYSVVGNMSYTLAEDMRRGANKKKYSLKGQSRNLGGAVDDLTSALAAAGAVKKGYKFKYVIVLHVDSAGGRFKVPGVKVGVKRVVAFGGLIDIEKNEIVAYIEKKLTLADNDKAILGQMPTDMGKIVDKLLGKKK